MTSLPPIPLSRPSIGEEEAEAVARVVRSGWLAQGQEVAALEEEFGRYLDPDDPPHVVATSSCTSALHIALLCAGARREVPVVAPSFTFVASVNAALFCDAPVELCDVDARTYNIDSSTLPVHVVCRHGGYHIVLAVHQVGLACDVGALCAVDSRATVVEDAACAIGARYADGVRVGARHDTLATCFSLHGSKSVVAGEGGLLATRLKRVAEDARCLRQHGADVGAENRVDAYAEQYIKLGYNYRMTDVEAAIARIQIGKADEIVRERRARAARYSEALRDVCIVPAALPDGSLHAYQRYLIRVADAESRERLVTHLTSSGIACRRGLRAVHRQPYWRARSLVNSHEHLPVTDMLTDTTVQLPLWADMPHEAIERVVSAAKAALR